MQNCCKITHKINYMQLLSIKMRALIILILKSCSVCFFTYLCISYVYTAENV